MRELKPPTVIPPVYDVNAHCEFHLGAPGHTIENWKALKYKVQDLIDSKAISFTLNGPNTNNNPMPPHVGSSVSVIEEGEKVMFCMDEIRTPLAIVKEKLLMNKIHPRCDVDLKDHLMNPQVYGKLKDGIQELIDQKAMLVKKNYLPWMK